MGFFETLRDSARNVIRELGNIRIGGQQTRAAVARKRPTAKSIAKKAEKGQVIPKITRAAAKKQKRELRIIDVPQEPAEFEKGKTDKDWNETLPETADDRVEKILSDEKPPAKKREHLFPRDEMPKKRRHLLFQNVGTDKILQCAFALTTGDPLPIWAEPFRANLRVRKNRLYFDGLPMAYKEEKRAAVKKLYFDPKMPSTINPICDSLRTKWANISRSNVQHILRSLETYQINFGRRMPPKVLGRMIIKKPGTIACDAYFPSRKFGWSRETGMCLTMMDVFSRFCWFYALEDKKKATVKIAMEDFMRKFAARGWLPKQGISDRGTDLSPFGEVFETYRGNRVGPLVFKSVTGAPVLVVEALNAQVQRRMEIFRTAGITDNPSKLLDDISYQINNQKRPDKQNLTPVQILNLTEGQIKTLYENSLDRTELAEPVKGLRALRVGSMVRVLLMDRKQQVKGLLKGFQPKWSRTVHYVLKITKLRKNPNVHRYFIGLSQSYFRHELLWIPPRVDRSVPYAATKAVRDKKDSVIRVGENWSDLEYDSDDSRAGD